MADEPQHANVCPFDAHYALGALSSIYLWMALWRTVRHDRIPKEFADGLEDLIRNGTLPILVSDSQKMALRCSDRVPDKWLQVHYARAMTPDAPLSASAQTELLEIVDEIGCAMMRIEAADDSKMKPILERAGFLSGTDRASVESEPPKASADARLSVTEIPAQMESGVDQVRPGKGTADASLIPTPKRLLLSWREITSALEQKNIQEFRRNLRQLNAQFAGPIIFGTKGSQPKVDKEKLIHWWNNLEIAFSDKEHQETGRRLNCAEQHPHGTSGTIAPEISGSVKSRRKS